MDADNYFKMYSEFVIPPEQMAAFQAERTACIIGEGLAKKFNIKLGDVIPITGTIYPGQWEFPVRGIYHPSKPDVDANTMYFRFDYLDQKMGGGVDAGFYVSKLASAEPGGRVGQAIDAKFANSAHETRSETEAAFQLGFISMLGNISFLVGIIGAAVIFAILLVTFNTMMMAARERTSEIAVMKTLGFPDQLILFIVIGEAILISCVGGFLGTGGAWAALRRRPVEPGRFRLQHAGDPVDVRPRYRAVDRDGRAVGARAGHPGLASPHRRRLPAGGVIMAIPLQYNVRNLFVRKLTTIVTIVGIGLVVAVFVSMLALAQGFQSALAGNGLPGNAIILRVPGNDELSSSITREWAAIIATQPEVAKGTDGQPLQVNEQVVVINLERKSTGGISNILTRGTSARALDIRPQVKLTSGRMFAPGTDEIIVGQLDLRTIPGRHARRAAQVRRPRVDDRRHLLRRRQGFRVGDLGRQRGLHPRVRPRRVPVHHGAAGRPGLLRRAAEAAGGRQAAAGEGEAGEQVLRRSVGPGGRARFACWVRFVTIVMALGAMFGALNTMYAAVGARRAEIGTLLALGFGRGSIELSFVFESILLAGLGGVLGCLLALPVNGISTGTTNFATFSEVAFRITVTPMILLFGMLFALLMGIIGGYFPARNASHSRIAESVRRA